MYVDIYHRSHLKFTQRNGLLSMGPSRITFVEHLRGIGYRLSNCVSQDQLGFAIVTSFEFSVT